MNKAYKSPTYITTDNTINYRYDCNAQRHKLRILCESENVVRMHSTVSSLFWQKPFVICNLVEVFLLVFKLTGLFQVFGPMFI